MKILALTDIHGQIRNISQLADVAAGCDAIVLAGDITDFGDYHDACSVISALGHFGIPVLGVCGNCDFPPVQDALAREGENLVQRPVEINGIVFKGLPFYRRQDEPVIELPRSPSGTCEKKLVLVTHQPPWHTRVDRTLLGRHTGNLAIRDCIEMYHPILVISGHIHEAAGTDTLGSTVLVNPGPFRNGHYALIDIRKDTVRPERHCL